MIRWDLARARSQQPARKYKPVGPVGEKLDATAPEMRDRTKDSRAHPHTSLYLTGHEISVCAGCGYHVCSCQPEYVPHVFRTPPTPPSIRGRIDTLERFRELGMLDTPGQREAIYRVLLDGDYSGFGVEP